MRIAPLPHSFDPPAPGPGTPAAAPGSRPFDVVLGDGAVEARPSPPAARPSPVTGSATLGILARAADSERAIDGFLQAAARGRTFTPGQLLAVQATVARYTQTVEVVSRAADRLVGAVKQTLGTQV